MCNPSCTRALGPLGCICAAVSASICVRLRRSLPTARCDLWIPLVTSPTCLPLPPNARSKLFNFAFEHIRKSMYPKKFGFCVVFIRRFFRSRIVLKTACHLLLSLLLHFVCICVMLIGAYENPNLTLDYILYSLFPAFGCESSRRETTQHNKSAISIAKQSWHQHKQWCKRINDFRIWKLNC